MNISDSSAFYGSVVLGATLENAIRQPLTAATVVMINQNKHFLGAAQTLYANGGIKGFYNGSQGTLISWSMRSSHRLTTFGLNQALNERGYSSASIALATTVAEFATTALGELILTVAQTPGKKTPFESIRERFHANGFSSLTTGFLGNNMRNIVFNGILFGMKNNLSEEVKAHPFSMSAVITISAVFFSHPIEVVRSLKVKTPEKSYLQIVKNLSHEGSLKSFYKGLLPRMASAGIGTFITMYTVSQITKK